MVVLHQFHTMSDPSKNNSNDISDFQDAASLLLKGGSLLRESCPDCSGVQIKFKDEIICVNCGKARSSNNESRSQPVLSDVQHDEREVSKPTTEISNIEKMVVERIIRLLFDMNNQTDVLNETRVANLIETYVRIVEKIRTL